jgi:hypothetical protein
MHIAEDRHDTPTSWPALAAGFSADVDVHLTPFQNSAKGGLPARPTAMQTLGDAQDTPDSAPGFAPAGVGAECSAHRLPSHDSTRAENRRLLTADIPTAWQLVADVHDTPFR